jgi:hypothetical protein
MILSLGSAVLAKSMTSGVFEVHFFNSILGLLSILTAALAAKDYLHTNTYSSFENGTLPSFSFQLL